jgi:protein-S-isoprenylcysteine O-methyltransferase Ste14
MVRRLVGSGDRIAVFTLPFDIVGLILEVMNPSILAVRGHPALLAVSIAVVIVGLAIWAWTLVLILTNVPRGVLITGGPYAWVKHPLYSAVALLVLPWLGFILGTWLGVVFGAALYLGSRIFAPAEEAELSRTFGGAWRRYDRSVLLHWL